MWTEGAAHKLNDCFHSTNWDVFKDTCTDLEMLTNIVSGYIAFCEEMIIPRKMITIYPNNKPWVSKSLKNILNQKKLAFYRGDIHQQKEAQRLVKKEIKLAKMKFKGKVEDELRSGNSHNA